jgi:Carbonic anhydrase
MRLHLGIAAPNAISPDEALKRVMDGNARYSSNMPAIEYGVRFLGVPLVMVLGHSGCGAVDAGGAPHGERARMLFDPAKMFRSPPRVPRSAKCLAFFQASTSGASSPNARVLTPLRRHWLEPRS